MNHRLLKEKGPQHYSKEYFSLGNTKANHCLFWVTHRSECGVLTHFSHKVANQEGRGELSGAADVCSGLLNQTLMLL